MEALVAAAIHDAKNALHALDTQLAELQRHPTSADFSVARATTTRIAAQLAELLTLYRAQGGQLRLAIDDHDLSDFLDDLLVELGPLPGGITLEVDRVAAASLGAWAFDAYLLKLALLDALRNALRHAKHQVSLALDAPAAGGICFAVSDDGPGFPESILCGEFATNTSSTGLGLVFARLIAERHATPDGYHGRLEIANTLGATLRILLP